MRGPGDTWGFILAAAFVCAPALFVTARAAQRNEIAALQERFDRETDPVHKAKLMQRLGVDEFDTIEKEVNDGSLPEAARILEQYREEARSCVEGLDAKKINAAKHSSGFKQLQISLQEALRRLDEILPALTADQQPAFIAARSEIQEMNDHLVQELFPGGPLGNPPAGKSSH